MKQIQKISLSVLIFFAIIFALAFSPLITQNVYSPKVPSSTLEPYINSYYYPVISSSRNNDKCTNEKVNFGVNFRTTSSTLPTSKSYCMHYEGKSFYYSMKTSIKTGSCANLGQEIFYKGSQKYLDNFKLIKKDSENYIICKDKVRGGYEYSTFRVNNNQICKISSSVPQLTEKEGKYFTSNGDIYLAPCGGGSKEKIVSCKIDAVKETLTFGNEGSVEIIKCGGDYTPNIKVCSSDGKKLYTTDSNGKLSSQDCSTCTNNICKPVVITPPVSPPTTRANECKLVYGGNNQINIITYSDDDVPDYGIWIKDELSKIAPFSEFTYNVYKEYPKGFCNTKLTLKKNDIRYGFEQLGSMWGFGYPPGLAPYTTNDIGNVKIDVDRPNKKYNYLLYHETGHVYLRQGTHTTDGSIMDNNMGNHQFTQSQVERMRINLKDTTKI